MKYLCIDVGGTYTKYAVMDEECNFFRKDKVPTVYDTLDRFVDMLVNIWKENRSEMEEIGEKIEGIALSSAGVIDSET
mgnify:FL=1